MTTTSIAQPTGPVDAAHAARAAFDAGLAVLPPSEDGSKAPLNKQKWKRYQTERPTLAELKAWYANGRTGLGVVCGAVSGNLEVLDFEGRAFEDDTFTRFLEAVFHSGLDDVWCRVMRGYWEDTPSGGVHVLYRCAEIAGNQKLANALDSATGEVLTLIETRGEGGYIVVAPSSGTVHETLRGWELKAGGFDTIATITPDERDGLLDCARSVDETRPPPPRDFKPAQSDRTDRPGDDYAARTSWTEILEPHGWTYGYTAADGRAYWRRPNKTHGSMSGDVDASGKWLFVFSSSTPFPAFDYADKVRAYAILNHGNDWDAAIKALAELGYGEQRTEHADLTQMILDGAPKAEVTEAIRVALEAGSTVNVAVDGYRLTDTGNSERLIALAEGRLRYVNAWGRWIVYADGRWTVDTSGALVTEFAKRVARNLLGLIPSASNSDDRKALFAWAMRSESAGSIGAMINLARGNPAILTEHEDLDAQPHLLNCRNGTVDLRTGELRPHDPADLLTLQTGVAYDPTAPRPLWESCLARWQPDDEIRRYLQLEAGAGATGHPTETLSVYFGLGANGKSKYVGALQHVLGDYATVPHKSLLIARHEQHETVKADLFRRRLCVASETKATDALDEEQVKALTGGDRMRARRMREDSWFFDPTHTLLLATNHKPTIKGRDEAVWRRVRLVPWAVTIPEAERDLDLRAKLETEGAGVLAWIVEGARRFLAEGFDPPAAVRAATGAYRSDEDLVGRFVAEVLVFDSRAGYTRSSELTTELDRWSREEGVTALTLAELAPELKARDCRQRRQEAGGIRATVWFGVTIRTDEET